MSKNEHIYCKDNATILTFGNNINFTATSIHFCHFIKMATSEKVLSNGIQQLLENPRDVFLDVTNLLLRFANNVLNDPENIKYRQIRVGNPIVEKRLLPINGTMECLFEMGFEEVRVTPLVLRTVARPKIMDGLRCLYEGCNIHLIINTEYSIF